MWHGGYVALASRRLRVIDLFRGKQPMSNEDGSVCVAFNGEIYNFQTLRDELEARGYRFTTLCDTEVVLRAYEAYGDDCLNRFNGMFAFAVYDKRADRLLLARDRLGIKPLFYALRDGLLAFASELDALLRSGLVRGRIHPAALDAYFTYLYIPCPDTVFTDARKLEPGEKLVFSRGKIEKEKYWTLRYSPDSSWTLPTAAERYRELLMDAVRLQRVSDVPIGALLSGGVDSSSVVACLSETTSAPIRTFTVGFDVSRYDELRYARVVANHFGTEHTETRLEPNLVDLIPRLPRHFGEPFADSSALPTWLVSQVARSQVIVALAGDGGDELFAGYTWAHRTLNSGWYRRWPQRIRRTLDALLQLTPRHPLFGKLRRFSKDSFQSLPEIFRRKHTCFAPEARARLYSREVARAVSREYVDHFQRHWDAAADLPEADRMLYHDTVMYLPDDILTKVDRMSMAHALEVRVPILDHRVVEFAATLPFSLKYRDGISKIVVKHAFQTLLPRTVLTQRKQGFAMPIHHWFRHPLRAHAEEVLLGGDARSRRFLDFGYIERLFRLHQHGKEHYGHHLWAILMFEHWLQYLENDVKLSPELLDEE